MLNKETINLVSEFAKVAGKSAEFITAQYSQWFFYSSICWIVLGVIICAFSFNIIFDEHSEVATWGQKLIRAGVFFIGFLFVGCHLPNLLTPNAAAIHQIIKDVNPKD